MFYPLGFIAIYRKLTFGDQLKVRISDWHVIYHWQNYSVIDYEEKVMDGFYDVYGITSNLVERGRMPLLVDLQTTSTSENLDYEVILVNRMVDNELKQLEKKAYKVSKNSHFPEQGLILSGLLQKLADIVVNRMGGPVGNADEILKRWNMRSRELRNSLRTIILPIGCLDVGLSRHRALLFKVVICFSSSFKCISKLTHMIHFFAINI